MASEWRTTTWGDEISLEYGRAIRGYSASVGKYRVFGSNGAIGWHSEYLADGPGVILGRKGAYRGVRFSRDPFFVIDTAYYVRPKIAFDMRWLYYAIIYHRLGEIDDGSPIPSTTRAAVYVRQLEVPPLDEQVAIASILGLIDDKIDAVREESNSLERIVRALFKSWFVDFDPVRAKAEGREPEGMDAATATIFPSELVDSQIGPIPAGWATGSLADCVTFYNSTRVPLSSAERSMRQGPFPYYGAAGPIDSVSDFLFDGEYVLVGEDGSVISPDGKPVVQHVWGKFWVNNHAHVLQPKNGWGVGGLLNLLRKVEIRPYVTGAVQPKLSMTNLKRVPVVIPAQELLSSFATQTDRILSRVCLNTEYMKTLAEIRDTLLPRLISGKLRVPEAEKLVEAAL